jgi:hypothetical protein
MKTQSMLPAWLLALALGAAPAVGHAAGAGGQIAHAVRVVAARAAAGPLAASMSDESPPGSGPEAVQFAPSQQLHNRLLLGGLLAWTGLIFGGLLYFSRRRVSGLTIVGVGVTVGGVLMAQSLGWLPS